MALSLADRLMRNVFVHANGCWVWKGAQASNGYGVIWSGEHTDSGHPKPAYVHRAAYEIHVGAIPDGTEIDHLCRVRNCLNPAHLEAVTHAENKRRARVTHCKRGHEMTPENTGARRMCKACDARRTADRRRRKVAA